MRPNMYICLGLVAAAALLASASADSACQENRRLPHPDSCSKYLRCTKGVWVEGGCPWYEHFDVKTSTCRNFFSATCGKVDCVEGDRRPVVAQCSEYEECRAGKWAQEDCSILHHNFNPKTKQCEFKYDCSLTPMCKEGETKAILGDCTGYQVCKGGAFKREVCSYKRNFNPDTKKCEMTYKCHYCRPGDKEPVEGDCKSYRVCEGGTMKEKMCGSVSRYDHQKKDCDWWWKVTCSKGPSPTDKPSTTKAPTPKRPTPPPKRPTPTPKKPTPRTESPNPPKDKCFDRQAQAINNSCSQYFECDPATGQYVVTSCRFCKNFNPKLGVCVWPWEYPCADPTLGPPTVRPPGCVNGQKTPVDCKHYQECVQNMWTVQKCGWFKNFDTITQECVYWGAKC